MTTGRKPLPTNLKLLKGTVNTTREKGKNEPKPKTENIRMPAGMPASARRHWKPLLRMLRDAGIMTVADTVALEALCIVYARWREANEAIAESGLLVRDQGRRLPKLNPYVRIANQSFDQLKSMLAEFGMTPSSRTRVNSTKGEDSEPADGWGTL